MWKIVIRPVLRYFSAKISFSSICTSAPTDTIAGPAASSTAGDERGLALGPESSTSRAPIVRSTTCSLASCTSRGSSHTPSRLHSLSSPPRATSRAAGAPPFSSERTPASSVRLRSCDRAIARPDLVTLKRSVRSSPSSSSSSSSSSDCCSMRLGWSSCRTRLGSNALSVLWRRLCLRAARCFRAAPGPSRAIARRRHCSIRILTMIWPCSFWPAFCRFSRCSCCAADSALSVSYREAARAPPVLSARHSSRVRESRLKLLQ